jgi:hypothetical protein
MQEEKMISNEIKEMIELYADNELEKKEHAVLFTALAADERAREYFFSLNYLKNAVEKDIVPFPAELEERVFNSLSNAEEKRGNISERGRAMRYILGTAAALFIIISTILFNELRMYKHQVDTMNEQISLQNRTIDLILNNSLPPAEIRSRTANEIIVRANL